MEACCLAKSGCLRLPSSSRKHPMLLVVLDLARAMLTNVLGTLGFVPRPAQLRKFESLKLLAMGAWHLIVALVAIFERRLNATRSDRKSTRLNSSHLGISYAVFCLKK